MAQLTSQAYITCLFTPVQSATLAAGSSAVNGITTPTLDMSNWNGAVFMWGLIGGGTSDVVNFSVRASSAARSVSGATLADSSAILSGSTSSLLTSSSQTYATFVADIYKPRQYATVGSAPFLFAQLSVGSSCAVFAQAWGIQYEPRAAGNTTAATTSSVPQSTQSSTGAGTVGQSGLFGGLLRPVSPST